MNWTVLTTLDYEQKDKSTVVMAINHNETTRFLNLETWSGYVSAHFPYFKSEFSSLCVDILREIFHPFR